MHRVRDICGYRLARKLFGYGATTFSGVCPVCATHLAKGDIASAVVTVKSHLPTTANMVMVDLGIPPRFELLGEDLDDYRNTCGGRKGPATWKSSV